MSFIAFNRTNTEFMGTFPTLEECNAWITSIQHRYNISSWSPLALFDVEKLVPKENFRRPNERPYTLPIIIYAYLNTGDISCGTDVAFGNIINVEEGNVWVREHRRLNPIMEKISLTMYALQNPS